MNFLKDLALLNTYTQKIDFMAKVIESVINTNSILADTVRRLHESHIRICKQTYRTWTCVCAKCGHEHEKNKDFEKCEKCGSDAVAFGFPDPAIDLIK